MICTIIIIISQLIKLGYWIYKSGKKHDFGDAIASVIAIAIEFAIFYGAGLFDKLGW